MTKVICALMLICMAAAAQAETLRLAVTTSFNNSGLSDILLPRIKADTGIEVQLLIVGTGQALRLGMAGDVDAILVHSKSDEDAFVGAGHGTHRTEIMYNDFVIIGPAADPAMIRQARTATDALIRIKARQATFISRGDDSGTHKKERSLWQAAGVDPDILQSWYKETGAGMGASLNTAAGLQGYILTDRASWLNFANKSGLAMLFAGDQVLFNQYAYLPVNSAQHPHVKSQAADRLETWLTGPTAGALIDGYRINDQQLFTFNAKND